MSKDRDNFKSTGPYPAKKNKSAFDEYEERGGIMEGYEDLNSSPSNEEDQILSQMIDHNQERSKS